MPGLLKLIPSRGKEYWDSLDPKNSKQVVEAVMTEVKSKPGSPSEPLIIILNSTADQSKTIFTTARVNHLVCLSPCAGFESASHVSAIAIYF
jgi:hypothetical protein